FLWLYTPSTTPGQVIRSRIPEYGTTGPNLIGQFVEQPRERYTAQYVRADSLPDASPVDVIRLVPNGHEQPYSEAKIWVGRADALPSYGVPLRITGGRSVASAVATPAAVASFIPRFWASSSAARPSARYSTASSWVRASRWRRIVATSPRSTGPVSAAIGS